MASKKIKRSVDLSNLEKRGSFYDWQKSVGKVIPFTYGNVESEIIIKEVIDSNNIIVEYKGVEVPMASRDIKECCFGTITGLSCNRPVVGLNTLYDTHYYLVEKEIITEEDSKEFTAGANKHIKTKCPDCGNSKDVFVSFLTKHGLKCACAEVNFSFSERIMFNVLNQLNVEFTFQLSKKNNPWCLNYRYDFYIPTLDMIIETNGLQHYLDGWDSVDKISAIDKAKKELALNNGIKEYIEVDCRYTDMEYIKNSILNSKLKSFFDMSNIDWNKIHEVASSNMVKEVCELWNNKEEHETARHIGDKVGISRISIVKFLKRGAELGWCNYDPKEKMSKANKLSGANTKETLGQKVYLYKDSILINIYNSQSELSKVSKEVLGIYIYPSGIRNALLKGKDINGYELSYVDKSTVKTVNVMVYRNDNKIYTADSQEQLSKVSDMILGIELSVNKINELLNNGKEYNGYILRAD